MTVFIREAHGEAPTDENTLSECIRTVADKEGPERGGSQFGSQFPELK